MQSRGANTGSNGPSKPTGLTGPLSGDNRFTLP